MSMTRSQLKQMQKNYEFMLCSPIVEKLQKKLKKLKKENRSLRRILTRIGDEPIGVIELLDDDDDDDDETNKHEELDIMHVKGEKITVKEEPHIVYHIEENKEVEEEEEVEYEEEEEEYEEEEEEGGKGGESPLEEEEVEYEEEEEEGGKGGESPLEEEEVEYEEEEEEGGKGGESPLEEEEEVFEVVIGGKKYFTADAENGEIYSVVDDDDVGDAVGMFKKGKARFYSV